MDQRSTAAAFTRAACQHFGGAALAANQVLMQFLKITAYALDGFAIAAETLVGQAMGARAVGDVRRASRISMQWGFGGAALMALIFALVGGPIIDLMTPPRPRCGWRRAATCGG